MRELNEDSLKRELTLGVLCEKLFWIFSGSIMKGSDDQAQLGTLHADPQYRMRVDWRRRWLLATCPLCAL